MALDKNIWREAIARYRAWNEAEFVEQVLTAGQKSPIERWREYQALVSLCWKLKPELSLWEQRRAVEEWEAYYDAMRRFEEWRHGCDKGTAAGIT